MIKIFLREELYRYDVFHLVKIYRPNTEIQVDVNGEFDFFLKIVEEHDCGEVHDILQIDVDVSESGIESQMKKTRKHDINIQVFEAFNHYTGKRPEWGILTGVRPTKLFMNRLDAGASIEDTVKEFTEYYKMEEAKARLSAEIAERERQLLDQIDYEDGYSLYIGIPFCKSRCSYCSFTAYPLHKWEDRVDEYVDVLIEELTAVARLSERKTLDTIYIGGGTPTSLSARQLERLLSSICNSFDLEHLQEFTIEAGRPDTITRGKLEVMKQYPVSRISINPQTMQEKTLKQIGRDHSAEEIYQIYQLARELGFDNINMDMIVGLPGETVSDVVDSLEKILSLEPDNLTVHSLAMKRASILNQNKVDIQEENSQENSIGEMLRQIEKAARNHELLPYYLYRQKNIAGNYENVGYAKVDKAGIYNILIMEEKQSIIAVGAGATTKLVGRGNDKKIERIENPKDVHQYMSTIKDIMKRKEERLWH